RDAGQTAHRALDAADVAAERDGAADAHDGPVALEDLHRLDRKHARGAKALLDLRLGPDPPVGANPQVGQERRIVGPGGAGSYRHGRTLPPLRAPRTRRTLSGTARGTVPAPE